MTSMRRSLGRHSDVILVLLMIGILVVLFTPIPPQLLDFLIITNFSFALLVLLLTFYMGKPVEFSTFPSLLLIATLFRLSLKIAATRLILGNADAGRVINAIGTFVIGGNYVIGLIVFIILVVVQYVVVTSGAQRVAEVAARFTLDSMPGQQMSIDADLNMGFIDQAEAQRRRKNIEKEANFYGSMDGASKFVKGDAIAGIIILFINIIGGMAVGVMQQGMPWSEALQTFTLLTVGDGIVTQVPALVIAVGTGIIVTRSASDTQLSTEVLQQMTAFPKTLVLVIAALMAFMFLPGIPVTPVLLLLAILGALTWIAFRAKSKSAGEKPSVAPADAAGSDDIYELLAIEPIEVSVGQNLVELVNGDDASLMERIAGFRKQYALDAGFVLPKVRIRDNKKLEADAYEIAIFGVAVAKGSIVADRILAIHPGGGRHKLEGTETLDPSYGLPAVWIAEDQRQTARASGYTLVDPATVFITHLSEIIRRNAANLLTRVETEALVDKVRQRQSGLAEELIPAVLSLSEIQKVLQNLLREKVSIRNLDAVLEVLVDSGRHTKDPEQLTELVRQRLGPVICQGLVGTGAELQVLTLDPAIEQTLAMSMRAVNEASTLVLEPRFAEQMLSKLAGQVEKMMKSNVMPVLLCSPELRRHLRKVTERVMPHLAILSMAEVPTNINLKAFGSVSL
ncbi:MAG: flagellar biosynthesis protein FlhA [Pseudomonadota bacterium]